MHFMSIHKDKNKHSRTQRNSMRQAYCLVTVCHILPDVDLIKILKTEYVLPRIFASLYKTQLMLILNTTFTRFGFTEHSIAINNIFILLLIINTPLPHIKHKNVSKTKLNYNVNSLQPCLKQERIIQHTILKYDLLPCLEKTHIKCRTCTPSFSLSAHPALTPFPY